MICNQDNCVEPATHRVFWPGREPGVSCEKHAQKAQAVGRAMGCYIHIEVLTPEQMVRGAPNEKTKPKA